MNDSRRPAGHEPALGPVGERIRDMATTAMTDLAARRRAIIDRIEELHGGILQPPFPGIIIFAIGLPFVWVLSRTGVPREYLDWLGQNQAQTLRLGLTMTVVGGLMGFAVMLALWLLSRRRDIALAILALMTVFLMIHPTIGLMSESIGLIGGLFGGLITAWRLLFWKPRVKPHTFGSAEWATETEIAARGMFDGQGFRLGAFPRTMANGKSAPAVLRYNGDRHLLTVAPTGAGKGRCAIVPNLLIHEGSVLCIDPKGENALTTAYARAKELGQTVHFVDPWNLVAHRFDVSPSCFNPLDWLKEGDPDLITNAMLLADALTMKETGGSHGSESFFNEESKSLLAGAMTYVAIDPAEKGKRTLGRVRELLTMDKEDLVKWFAAMSMSQNRFVRSTGSRALQKDSELLSNVMATVQAQTHVLESEPIRNSLSRSDFDFADLKNGNVTIYLILPADRIDATFSRWLRLLIQQAITVNARNTDVKPKKPVLFLLDEMAALGRLEKVHQAYGLMRGFGMQLWGIVQDLSQLEEHYGKGWQSFIANSGVLQYFGSRDEMTASYFSKLTGMATVQDSGWSIARTFSGGSHGGNSSTETWNYSDKQRNLAFADELMRLNGDKQLLLVENMNPIAAEKTLWDRDPVLSKRGFNLYKEAQPAAAPNAAMPMAAE